MTSVTVSIMSSKQTAKTLRVKRWDESPMQADGFSASLLGDVGQFARITPYFMQAGVWVGSWSSNANYRVLYHNDLLRIAALQTDDEKTVDQKMNWLTAGDTFASPIFTEGRDWDVVANAHLAGAVYAGQPVTVIDHATKTIRFNGKTETVPMSRIQTGWGVVQYVTAVSREDKYLLRPCGLVRLPIIVAFEETWLLDRWLVEG